MVIQGQGSLLDRDEDSHFSVSARKPPSFPYLGFFSPTKVSEFLSELILYLVDKAHRPGPELGL